MGRIIISFLVFILFGCQENRQKDKDAVADESAFFTIDIEKALNNPMAVQLSDIASEVKYIPLETNSNNLISRVIDAKIGKQYLFILANRAVFQFTLDGSFVRQIGRLGRGPQEYSLARCFSVDENRELVFIHSNEQKLLVFDFEGRFVERIHFPNLGAGLIVWNQNSTFLQYSEGDFEVGGFVFTERNKRGDTLQSVLNYYGFEKRPDKVFLVEYFNRNKFYRYNKNLHFKSWYNDTIYTFNEQGNIYPKYSVDLKRFKLPEKYFYNKVPINNPKDYYWFGVHESNRFIFINYSSYLTTLEDNPGGIVFFDKKTKESYSISNLTSHKGLLNDSLGGAGFIPRFVNDSLAFNFVDAFTMKHHFANLSSASIKMNNPDFYKMIAELKDNSNPIMQIVLLKE